MSQQHPGIRTVVLRQLDGKAIEVANDDSRCRVLANLPTRWPFITLPRKKTRIERIILTRNGNSSAIQPMIGWVPADPLHNGGVIYFHPNLKLRPGEVLVAHHLDGSSTRINVTKTFGTVQRKLDLTEAKQQPVSVPPNLYDRLLGDDD